MHSNSYWSFLKLCLVTLFPVRYTPSLLSKALFLICSLCLCVHFLGVEKALSSVLINHFREITNHFLIENEKTSGQNDWKFYLFPNFIRLFHTAIKFYWQILKLVYNLHLQGIIVNNNNCTKGILFFENENQGYLILVGNRKVLVPS